MSWPIGISDDNDKMKLMHATRNVSLILKTTANDLFDLITSQ